MVQGTSDQQQATRDWKGSIGGGSEDDGEQNAPPCLSKRVVVMRWRSLQQRQCLCMVVCWCVCGDCNRSWALRSGLVAAEAAARAMGSTMHRRACPGA